MSVSIRISDMQTCETKDIHSRAECSDSMEESMYDIMNSGGETNITMGAFTCDWLPDGVKPWYE